MSWYLEVLRKFASFGGRASRPEYWYFVLVNLLFSLLLGVADGVAGTFNPDTGMGLLGTIYLLAVLVPSLAVTVRRLHDGGRSAWWLLLLVVPLIGPLGLLILMALPGSEGENRYGPPAATLPQGRGDPKLL